MYFRAGIIIASLLTGCAETELPARAVSLCETAVRMSVEDRRSIQMLTVFDAKRLPENSPHEARIGLPSDLVHVIGITYAATIRNMHHEGKAFCGFRGAPEKLDLAHVIVDGRELDSFSIDAAKARFRDGIVSQEQL